jgi:hypothetical protein
MAIDELNKIDRIMTNKEKTAVYLLLSDHLDWEEEGEHLEFLQAKLNVYLDFIENGELVRRRPDLTGLPVTISVAAKYPPTDFASKFYRAAGPLAAEAGVSLELRSGNPEEIIRY